MSKLPYLFALLFLCPVAVPAQEGGKGDAANPTLAVTGHGEILAAPDQAIVRLGAVIQAREAADAQREANKIVAQALAKLKQLDIPAERITTVGLSLSPVFSRPPQNAVEEPQEPRIAGYRAHNSIQIVIDAINQVGAVIDAGVSAGANQLEGLSFEIKEDGEYRERALRLAVAEARRKANVIAEAAGVNIVGVNEISEGGVHLVRPQMHMARTFSDEAATPVQPGQVSVQASVTVRFHITPAD
ncbi:SIMPL domain-containing protein [Desulfoferrobacter suflitae]|uniref:SIMPL domain-containing protein n=1 Tax=Desulfoferrobacter suflitae TaxID=2865782 RepID=UPI002164B20C|nr:SIMPL domain-containing protein [Desulfoferrobacter suflitae]MCK8602174.1 SIMPL domain-containing protein [Desulfoferrobacter suflitae]